MSMNTPNEMSSITQSAAKIRRRKYMSIGYPAIAFTRQLSQGSIHPASVFSGVDRDAGRYSRRY
jgi:hypothetical protein